MTDEHNDEMPDLPLISPEIPPAPTHYPDGSPVTKQNRPRVYPCACGEDKVNLMIDPGQGTKIGHVTCGSCGVWGVDFLSPVTQDQEKIKQVAMKAWNEAPRAS